MSQIGHILIKLAFSGGLLAVIYLCGNELYRLWFDHRPVLAQFTYTRDGAPNPAAGLTFTRLLSHDLGRLMRIYTGEPQDCPGDDSQATLDFAPFVNMNINVPQLRQSAFQNVEIKAYGVQWDSVFKSLSRWLRRPAEISGSVTEVKAVYDIYGELTGASVGEPAVWDLPSRKQLEEGRFLLACRIFRLLASQASEVFGATEDERADEDFALFTAAFQEYELYLRRQREGKSAEEIRAALDGAAGKLETLLQRQTSIVLAHGLAGYVYRAKGETVPAVEALRRYKKLLTKVSHEDRCALKLLAALEPDLETPPETAAGLRTQSPTLRPGLSIGSATSSAGTLCCVVESLTGQERYLLSADHAFVGTFGEPILQPGPIDGGSVERDVVARLERRVELQPGVANTAGGAIALLEPGRDAENVITDFGPIRGIAGSSALRPGQKVVAFARTSGRTEGTIESLDFTVILYTSDGPVRFTGMVLAELVSKGGDSGAPVLTEDGRLIGMIYAGTQDRTIIMPIEPLLGALEVKLAS